MSGQVLTRHEAAGFWNRIGVKPDQLFEERRSATVQGAFLLGDLPIRPAGHRGAHRTLPPSRRAELLDRRIAAFHARIDAIEAGATSLDQLDEASAWANRL